MPTRSGPTERSPAETDERLMERLQRGEVDAFEPLFQRWRGPLFGFLVRRCGDAATAEDLSQETWLRVVKARDRYDPSRRFSTWMFQIGNNLCRDRARRREVENRGRDSVKQATAMLPRVSEPDIDLQLEMRERLAELPDRLREVLLLRYYQELPEREIAQIVGVPAGTVKSRLHAAVRALRDREETRDGD